VDPKQSICRGHAYHFQCWNLCNRPAYIWMNMLMLLTNIVHKLCCYFWEWRVTLLRLQAIGDNTRSTVSGQNGADRYT
jgi:hypothetical protein